MTSDYWKEFVCPITLVLPITPVMAEDGKVYEEEVMEYIH